MTLRTAISTFFPLIVYCKNKLISFRKQLCPLRFTSSILNANIGRGHYEKLRGHSNTNIERRHKYLKIKVFWLNLLTGISDTGRISAGTCRGERFSLIDFFREATNSVVNCCPSTSNTNNTTLSSDLL